MLIVVTYYKKNNKEKTMKTKRERVASYLLLILITGLLIPYMCEFGATIFTISPILGSALFIIIIMLTSNEIESTVLKIMNITLGDKEEEKTNE
jgi:membrane-associated HD superfamily phosphohydrolase